MINDPTNIADEKVASYRFIHLVNMRSPEKALSAAKLISMKKYHGRASSFALQALMTDSESFRKFWNPVIDPLETPL